MRREGGHSLVISEGREGKRPCNIRSDGNLACDHNALERHISDGRDVHEVCADKIRIKKKAPHLATEVG